MSNTMASEDFSCSIDLTMSEIPTSNTGDVKDPIIILKAGVYNSEIKRDILSNINSEVNFLE